jgi:type 1 glutamine amidotransferase
MKNNRNNTMRALAIMIAIGGVIDSVEAQTPGAPAATTPAPAAAPAGRGRGRGGPQFTGASVSVRPETQPPARTQAATLLGWRVGIRTDAFGPLTFSEASAKADAGGMASVEGVSTQKVSAEIAKNLDYNLTAAEVDKVKARLNELRLVMPAYDAGAIPGDAASRRKVFEFAKSLGADMIIGSADAASLADLDKLATELTMNVALTSKDPKSMVGPMASLSERMGLSVDIGAWMEAGGKPLAAVAQLKNRLLAVNLRDRSALGAKGHNVILGTGVAGVEPFLLEMSKLQPPTIQDNWPPTTDGGAKRSEGKPVYITLDPTGAGDPVANLTSSGAAFDKAVPPAVYYRVSTLSRMETITPFERVPADERAKVDAAIPRQALAKPKKARKLLVMDLCVNGGYYHSSIQLGNLSLYLMAKYTDAYIPTFDNNIENLKYPKIKQWDAIFLNNIEGSVFADPEVLEGLLRFVREGGGVAGLHAASWASTDVAAFGELMGSQTGAHKYNGEPGSLRIDDPNSPLMKQFGGKGFDITDEFYHYLPNGPYSREKLHVLLSIDPNKKDLPANQYTTRPDNDYGMAWIRSYGKGRVFQCGMGHRPDFYESANMQQMIFAAVQFILGDLDADTTPSAKLK